MEVSQKIIDALKSIGLNKYERNLYIALLMKGNATAGELSDLAKVPRSRCYDTLESLADKGFVIIQHGRPVRFIAVQPSEALERWKKRYEEKIREMQKRIDDLKNSEILKELEKLYQKGLELIEPEEITGTIKGKRPFLDHLESLLKFANKSLEIFAGSETLREMYENFADLLIKAKERNVEMKFLLSDTKDKELIDLLKAFGEVKIANVDIKGDFAIIDSNNLIINLTQPTVFESNYLALWTKSRTVTQHLIKPVFDLIWEKYSSKV
jgi:sugar-specific transcriptional regulator TrmB